MGRHGVAGRGVLSRLCRSCPRGAGRGESKMSDAAVSGAGVRGREGGLSDVTQVLWVHPHTILPAPFRLEEMYRAVQQMSCKLLGTTRTSLYTLTCAHSWLSKSNTQCPHYAMTNCHSFVRSTLVCLRDGFNSNLKAAPSFGGFTQMCTVAWMWWLQRQRPKAALPEGQNI